MPHTIRPHLIASLVALHAAISLCGPGHHGSAGPVHLALEADDHAGATAQPADHCPVCDYLSKCQLPIEPVCPAPGERAEVADRGEHPSQPPTAPLHPSFPRAPPTRA